VGERLFVGVWPPPEVAAAVAALTRPPLPSLRWTTPDQWHVTLRFLGEVPGEEVGPLAEALREAAPAWPAVEARLGPATVRLDRSLLVAPVTGLGDLAAAVAAATRAVGPRPTRAFTGHLTLARGRGRHPVRADLAGEEVAAVWTVGEVALVRSRLHPDGARYDDVAVVGLGG
jgi:RNA 2',3'-cyclic 3'-phosphodiesterase